MKKISIHALREEGDWGRSPTHHPPKDFNPRPPRGGRLWRGHTTVNFERFQSTPSARRATAPSLFTGDGNNISIHALREEGDGAV